jgi:bifunctional enzyme CysN/CysC
MAHVSDLIASDIDQYLKTHERKSLLRFITCGSVDDGKSTLIGRLLYESKMLFEDQLAAVEADSKKWGTQGDQIDFALLVDGLAAEREQGITIDVAYRFFSTDKRKFIVADTPGHEQYTRNMVTGASTADVAVLMVDARKGILTQTRRHSYLVSLIGIRNVVVAINKMDLVDYDEAVFRRIVDDYSAFAAQLGLHQVSFIPLSAVRGDNIIAPGTAMPWYRGSTLMDYLETVEIDEARMQRGPLRLPVQWVNRPHLDFRGFAGTIASGVVRPGERICVQPSGRTSTVARIVTRDGDLALAVAGQSVTLTLSDEIDISRGDVISALEASITVADRFEAMLVWMHDEPLRPGRPYLLKIGTRTVTATVAAIRHQVNVNTLEQVAAGVLELNAIGLCQLDLDRPVAFDPYADNRDTGGFILIDRLSNNTVGAGMLQRALPRMQPQGQQATEVDAAARARIKGQKGGVLWFSAAAAAQAAAVATRVEQKLHALGRHTFLLDEQILAEGLNRDLGPGAAERAEALRRAGEGARLMVEAGLVVLVACAAPLREQRYRLHEQLAAAGFIEIHLDQAAVPGDAQFEAPMAPALRVDATGVEAAAEQVLAWLEHSGRLAPEAAWYPQI